MGNTPYYLLGNDINLTGMNWTGSVVPFFSGIFDGNEHTLRNIDVNIPGAAYVGLFGYLGTNGQIKNLKVEDISIFGTYFVGGLVGWNNWGDISNCYSTGLVSGTGNCIGGLVGFSYGDISNCYSTGSVSGTGDYVGGLVGWNNLGGTISNCYSTNSVSGNKEVGGLVGNNHADSTISNCYATGSVSGSAYVGGLVGYKWGNISNCYSTGLIIGTGDYFGGLIGYSYIGIVSSSFWDIETSDCNTSAGGTGKTTTEMKTNNTFTDAGWDFVEIWGIGEHQTYPYLLTGPTGDFNYDKEVNFIDLAILSSHWLEEK